MNIKFKTLISNLSPLHYFLLQMIVIIIIDLLAEQLVLRGSLMDDQLHGYIKMIFLDLKR